MVARVGSAGALHPQALSNRSRQHSSHSSDDDSTGAARTNLPIPCRGCRAGLDERRQVLNHHLPSRALDGKPPLEAYPHAIHSGRSYRPEWEEELLSLEKVCNYLAQGRWFRGVRSNGYFGGGRYQYYLGKHFARCGVAIRFDPDTTTLMCQLEGSEESIGLPAQGITRAELMGELALLQALPIYQLALPFSLAAWRQLEYALNLTGTTL